MSYRITLYTLGEQLPDNPITSTYPNHNSTYVMEIKRRGSWVCKNILVVFSTRFNEISIDKDT